MWPIYSGDIRIDGAALSHWDNEQLGVHIGYLPQDVELFSGTVAENIARFQAIDEEMVIAAAQLAGVHAMIQAMPEGYNTQIGDGGQSLSGGQRQRIGLARALYRMPKLVILDEPNASLDSDGEAALLNTLRSLKAENRTVILITHKTNILAMMDKILVLNQGTMRGFGDRDEIFAKLLVPRVVGPTGAQPDGPPDSGNKIVKAMDSERSSEHPLPSAVRSSLPASSKGKADSVHLRLQALAAEGAPVPDWKRPAMLGYIVIILAFGVMGGWSAFARLDSAVVAPGTVTLESNKKTIQHFEGGIIARILVHEGEHVDQGQILFMLDNTQAQANANAHRNQLDAFLAQEARLVAERNNAEQVTYPPELMNRMSEPIVKDAISDENKQFNERRASLVGQIAIQKSRIKEFATQIAGISDEKAATERQLGLINSELADLLQLLEKKLVQKSRVLALERERARLEGVIGRAVADIAKAQNGIGEAHLQIEQLRKKFSEDVNAQILQVREKIAELREKATISEDVLHRIQIRAPRAGTIQNMHVATVGGVIRPGEQLAELVPDDDSLVVNAEVSPTDVDAIEAGTQAEVRFSAFHGYTLPLILGHVESVSHDRIIDEHSTSSRIFWRVLWSTRTTSRRSSRTILKQACQ